MVSLIALFLVIFVIIVTYIQKNHHKRTRYPPGPSGFPLIGNLHQLNSPLHEHFYKLSIKHGPLVYMKLGSRPILIANSSKMADEILKTQDFNFCSRPPFLALKTLSYNCLDIAFSPYTESWREMRKIAIVNLLSSKRMQSFSHIREDEVSRLMDIVSKHALSREVVDLTEPIVFFTNSVISRVVFGRRYEHGSGETMKFSQIILEFQDVMSEFYFSDYFPLVGGWIDEVIGKKGHLDRVFKKWDAYYEQLIHEHLGPEKTKSMEDDVLDILLKLREENSSGSFHMISMDHIKAVIMNMYFASTDTIGTTTIWILTSLLKNPSAMKKTQEEIRELGSSLSGNKKMLKEEDIMSAELPYLNAVIRESMRLYSTIPLLLPRETLQKCTIDGFDIPEKTTVHVNSWAISHDPDIWENPNEFIPERFLIGNKLNDKDFTGQDFEFIPFGGGRRGCPGISMALVTMQLVVANLVYLFDWGRPDGLKMEDIDTDSGDGISVHKKTPLCVIATKFI